MESLTEALNGAQAGMDAKEADNIPAQVGRTAGAPAEQDIGKSIR